MPPAVNIVAAGNTYNPCLLLLQRKGYQLYAEESGERLLWMASKDDSSFLAYSPPELLGVVVLGEIFGQEWNQQKPNLLGEVLENASEEKKPG
jgi:hypothetical protein